MKWKCRNTIIKKIKSKQISQRGSSSVLVIMIMLMLITFGVLAMMSSYSNLKMSRKHAQWTSEYYGLESQANLDLLKFSLALDESVLRTDNYIDEALFNSSEVEGISRSAQENIREQIQVNDALTLSNSELVNRLNLLFLFDEVSNTLGNEAIVECSFCDESILDINNTLKTTTLSFISKMDYGDRRLLVTVKMNNLHNLETDKFEVVEWKEIPLEFLYNDKIEFGDPEGN